MAAMNVLVVLQLVVIWTSAPTADSGSLRHANTDNQTLIDANLQITEEVLQESANDTISEGNTKWDEVPETSISEAVGVPQDESDLGAQISKEHQQRLKHRRRKHRRKPHPRKSRVRNLRNSTKSLSPLCGDGDGLSPALSLTCGSIVSTSNDSVTDDNDDVNGTVVGDDVDDQLVAAVHGPIHSTNIFSKAESDPGDLWVDEHYLKLGINPNIEISIEVLHEEAKRKDEAVPALIFVDKLLANRTVGVIVKPSSQNNFSIADGQSPILFTEVEDIKSSEKKEQGNGNFNIPANLLPLAINGFEEELGLKTAEEGTANIDDAGADICSRWMECSGEQLLVRLAKLNSLPNCPCFYSFSVHYNEQIWDETHDRFFRWRDASGPQDRLDVYKPGARWCIRSLMSETSTSLAAQQCCYDSERKLITRGAGAGTPNVVSPEISRDLNYRVDILPWIVCKGDWTRYHQRRPPNNQSNCRKNPNNKEFAKQIKRAKEY